MLLKVSSLQNSYTYMTQVHNKENKNTTFIFEGIVKKNTT